MDKPKRFLRLPAVIEAVGLGKTAIYGRIKAGTFPQPVQIGTRAVAWDAAAIAIWQAGRVTGVKKTAV